MTEQRIEQLAVMAGFLGTKDRYNCSFKELQCFSELLLFEVISQQSKPVAIKNLTDEERWNIGKKLGMRVRHSRLQLRFAEEVELAFVEKNGLRIEARKERDDCEWF